MKRVLPTFFNAISHLLITITFNIKQIFDEPGPQHILFHICNIDNFSTHSTLLEEVQGGYLSGNANYGC